MIAKRLVEIRTKFRGWPTKMIHVFIAFQSQDYLRKYELKLQIHFFIVFQTSKVRYEPKQHDFSIIFYEFTSSDSQNLQS